MHHVCIAPTHVVHVAKSGAAVTSAPAKRLQASVVPPRQDTNGFAGVAQYLAFSAVEYAEKNKFGR